MSILVIVLIVLLVLACAGVGPWWGHSRDWGYGPSGIIGALLLVILLAWLTGHLR